MPTGMYDHKNNSGLFKKGHKSFLTEESKKRISEAHKGHPNYNIEKKGCFVKGHKSLNYSGYKHSEKAKKGMSIAKKLKYFNLQPINGFKRGEDNVAKRADIRLKISQKRKQYFDKIGRKTKRYQHVRDTKYLQWRKNVFERDNYICQRCKIHSGLGKTVYLEAHHIKSYTKFLELRTDINNGITLCRDCHRLTDNYKNRKSKP